MEKINLKMFKAWAEILKNQCELSECGKCPFYNPKDGFCIIRTITYAEPPCDWNVEGAVTKNL